MTYSQGGPGYPPAQPTTQFAAPTQQFSKPGPDEPAGASKLPLYLTAAVIVLGLAAYLLSYGPVWKSNQLDTLGVPDGMSGSPQLAFTIVASLLAALLAAVALVPRQKSRFAAVAVLSVLAFLLALSGLLNTPSYASIGWALIVIVVVVGLQAIVAVGALLLEAGVVTPPAPRPKYDQQQQYGQYGGPGQYYGQPGQQHAPQQGGPQQHSPQQQRPGYPTQYGGGGGGYPSGPHTGGFSALGPQSGTATPPTGFPSFGGPQSPGSAPTTQVPAQQPPQQQSPSSSGPAPS
jgi:hypothetical protein